MLSYLAEHLFKQELMVRPSRLVMRLRVYKATRSALRQPLILLFLLEPLRCEA